MEPSSKHTIFISYWRHDAEAAELLRDFLSNAGFQPFVAHHNIRGGEEWRQALREALAEARVLLLLCSPEATQSPWVMSEAGAAWVKEIPVIPLCYGGSRQDSLPGPLASVQAYNLTESSDIDRLIEQLGKETKTHPKKHGIEDFTNSLRRAEKERRPGKGSAIKVSRTSRRLKFKRELQANTLGRGDISALDTIVDAAVYVDDQRHSYPEEIRKCISKNVTIPSRFLFWTDDGCSQWLERCRDARYTWYRKSVGHIKSNIRSFTDKIEETLGTTSVDLISLGCGDGSKDSLILKHLVAALPEGSEPVYYYPVDISEAMICAAIQTINKDNFDPSKLLAKAIIADFTALYPLKDVFEWRDSRPNLWSILGNTFGNASEQEILKALDSAMEPGDLLLLEVATGSNIDQHSTGGLNPQGIAALKALDIKIDKSRIKIERAKDSIVPGAKTLRYIYEGLDLNGRARNAILSCVHYYDLPQLIDHLSRTLKINKIHTREGDGVTLFLGQRELST